jgi:hypothetical protein
MKKVGNVSKLRCVSYLKRISYLRNNRKLFESIVNDLEIYNSLSLKEKIKVVKTVFDGNYTISVDKIDKKIYIFDTLAEEYIVDFETHLSSIIESLFSTINMEVVAV